MKARAVVVLAVIVSGMAVAPSTALPGGANGRIAFERASGRHSRIFTVTPDGKDRRRISPDRGFNTTPAFSSDGTKIAFSRIPPGKSTWSIYVANEDGSQRTLLTERGFGPVWSPDGTKIVFTRLYKDLSSDIFVIDSDGTGRVRLTGPEGEDFDPVWSPDGTKIAFVSGRDNPAEVYVMNADGSGQTPLTDGRRTPDYTPRWSPDGTKILFSRELISGGTDLLSMNPDGSNKVNITKDSDFESTPSWSPDSSKIVYSRLRTQFEQVMIISADGSERTKLTGERSNYDPVWSPDGNQIAFISTRGGNEDLHVMSSDGASQKRLTSSPGVEFAPAWQAIPVAIPASDASGTP